MADIKDVEWALRQNDKVRELWPGTGRDGTALPFISNVVDRGGGGGDAKTHSSLPFSILVKLADYIYFVRVLFTSICIYLCLFTPSDFFCHVLLRVHVASPPPPQGQIGRHRGGGAGQ